MGKKKKVKILKKIKKAIKKIIKYLASTGIVLLVIQLSPDIIGFLGLEDIGKQKPSISTAEISVDYLTNSNNNERDSQIYPLFQDKINPSKGYKLFEKCATQIYITNHYSKEIVLNKIRFVAEEISKNDAPVILLKSEMGWGEVDLQISNIGWSDGTDLQLTFEDDKNCIKKDKLSLNIEEIKTAETKVVELWDNNDLISGIEDGTYEFTATCVDKDKHSIVLKYIDELGERVSGIQVYIMDDGFVSMGIGGPSHAIYGVAIDTEKDKFVYEEEIEEYISSGEELGLPICFYPDKSCSMKFHVEFEGIHSGKKFTVSSDTRTLEFEIPSITDSEIYNVKDYNKKELEKEARQEFSIISYPFVEKELMR